MSDGSRTDGTQSPPRTGLLGNLPVAGFYALLLNYPLLSLAWRRSYPLLSMEVGILAASFLAASLGLAWVLCRVRPQLAAAFTALVASLVLVIQFDLLLGGVVACLLITALLAVLLKRHLYPYGLPVLAAMVVGAFLDARQEVEMGAPPSSEPGRDGPPPVVHVLLDGFVGLDGLLDLPESGAVRERLLDLFRRHGFIVFPRAYSRFGATVDSTYSAFNFYHGDAPPINLEEDSRKWHFMRENRHFQAMADAGYRLRVYQTQYLNFCEYQGGSAEYCWSYPQPNLRALREVASPVRRAVALATVLYGQSVLVSDLFDIAPRLKRLGITHYDPRVWSELERDVLAAPEGRYFFAHVLLPHRPYVHAPDCAINGPGPEAGSAAAARRADRIAMLDQIDCTLGAIQVLLETLRTAGIQDRATVLLHGDHGSFLGRFPPYLRYMNRMGKDDYRAAFSTLFAVRFPAGTHAVDPRSLPLPFLMEMFSEAVVRGASGLPVAAFDEGPVSGDPARLAPYVYLKDVYPLHRVDVELFDP